MQAFKFSLKNSNKRSISQHLHDFHVFMSLSRHTIVSNVSTKLIPVVFPSRYDRSEAFAHFIKENLIEKKQPFE